MVYPEGKMAESNQEAGNSAESVPSPGLSPEQIAELPADVRVYIEGLHEQIRELEELAGHDALTGLDNRRRFDETLLREIASSARSGKPFSLIMIDIDDFKILNDLYGHTAGDQALREVSQGIQVSLRRYDQAFRYGGEELAVFLNLDINSAIGVAERIRKRIASEVPVTISLGVAQFSPDPGLRTTDEEKLQTLGKGLVDMADQALFATKDAGKNKTAFWGLDGKISVITPKANGPKDRSGK